MFLEISNIHSFEDMEYMFDLMYEAIKIQIHFLDKHGNYVYGFPSDPMINPLYATKHEIFSQILASNDSCDFPVLTSTKYYENFFSIKIKSEESFLGTIIVGPSISIEIDAATIDKMINEFNLYLKYKIELLNYYKSLPQANYLRFVKLSMLFFYSIYKQKLDISNVIEKNLRQENISSKIENELESSMLKSRQYGFVHNTPVYEKFLLQCVKEGDKERLMKHIGKSTDGEAGILSRNNPIRNQKNLIICAITLIARSAIEGGLSSELALSLSDKYIQNVEEISDLKSLMSLYIKIWCEYTDRVRSIKENKYSKTVLKCQNYISRHLYKDISLKQLAEKVNMNSSYLSDLFSSEVGIPISQYIQRERIEEAKKLLTLTDYSILDICISLNFHDQGYFTKVFKKFTGLTPKKFRELNNLL